VAAVFVLLLLLVVVVLVVVAETLSDVPPRNIEHFKLIFHAEDFSGKRICVGYFVLRKQAFGTQSTRTRLDGKGKRNCLSFTGIEIT
jgi:hypothetical protein